jgi:coenzyme F420-reducing hydrogenase alpha subunit
VSDRKIRIDYLTRVEGESALVIRVKDAKVHSVRLKIFEPPRLFESLLKGHPYSDVPDITSRICGICPVAYQMSAVHALERAFGVTIDPQVRELRRLLYCGEWLASHTLHVFMLQAPDLFGMHDFIEMAKDHPEFATEALRLKKVGNRIMTLLGGREIHPVGAVTGGFSKLPARADLLILREELLWARDAAVEKARFFATFQFPDFEQDYEFVALSHPREYPMNEGRLVSNRGLDIDASEYERVFVEKQVRHSTALHSTIRGRGAYLLGPLARFNLNFDKLSKLARETAAECGLRPVCRNPFKSILVRMVEVVYALEEAIRIIDNYRPGSPPCADFAVRAGTGYAITEAPRGALFVRYGVNADGTIESARITPPTSQNQKQIELDLAGYVAGMTSLASDELASRCEQAVRNYDPCISCATHFLKVEVQDDAGHSRLRKSGPRR